MQALCDASIARVLRVLSGLMQGMPVYIYIYICKISSALDKLDVFVVVVVVVVALTMTHRHNIGYRLLRKP